MADLYAFDIQPSHIYAIGVTRDGKVSTVESCVAVATTPETAEQALPEVCEQIGFTGGAAFVSLSCEFVSFTTLVLPFQDKKKIAQILPFELDDRIPGDVNDTVYDYLFSADPEQPAHSLLTVGMVAKSALAHLLSQLKNVGIDPDVVGISGQSLAARIAHHVQGKLVVLDQTATGITLFICSDGVIRTIRFYSFAEDSAQKRLSAPDFLRWLRQTLFATKLVDIRNPDYDVVLINDTVPQEECERLSAALLGAKVGFLPPAALALLKISPNVGQSYERGSMNRLLGYCNPREKVSEFNFRTQDFRKIWSWETYRKYALIAGVPVFALLVILIAYFARDYSRQVSARDALQFDITGVFKETMPEVQRIVNPLQQLQIAVNEKKAVYRPSGGTNQFNVLNILAELSARIKPEYNVKFTRLVADVDNIRIRGVTKDFNTVDTIQKLLEQSSMFSSATISSANQSLQDNEVRFELKLDFFR